MAYGINSSGNVVGTYYDAGGNSHGFTYKGTNYNAINYTGTGVIGTQLNGINNNNTLMGGYDSTGPSGGLRCNFTGSSCNTISLGVSYSGFEAKGLHLLRRRLYNGRLPGIDRHGNHRHQRHRRDCGVVHRFIGKLQRVHGRPDSRAGQPRAGGPGASIRHGVALAAPSMLKGADRRG
jgi:hypothetical protein